MVTTLIKRIGVLRFLLVTLVAIFILASRFTGEQAAYSGWEMIPTLIVPAVAPIVFFVLLLDMMMAGVFMVDKQGDERKRFKFIVNLDLLLTIGMLVSWVPYFISIASV